MEGSFFWDFYKCFHEQKKIEKKLWDEYMEQAYKEYEEEVREQEEWKQIMSMTDEEYEYYYGSDTEEYIEIEDKKINLKKKNKLQN